MKMAHRGQVNLHKICCLPQDIGLAEPFGSSDWWQLFSRKTEEWLLARTW
jgi:hypothetical protein